MKKLTFKVSAPKEGSMVALIKEINQISCRIQLDIEKGLVIVENINDSMIDTIIELVNRYYILFGIDIDNTFESEVEIPNDDLKSEHKCSVKPIELQSEDGLIIQKVKFVNEYVEQVVDKLLKTVYWAMFKRNVSEKEVGEYIWTCIHEISMTYHEKENIAFSIGDVVKCDYGIHLPGEINGTHVSAIVCNISLAGMVYLVPIIRAKENLKSHSYLIANIPNDLTYEKMDYTDEVVLLDKGKYVCPERLKEVIGKTSQDFFKKILSQLAYTFNFSIIHSTIEKVSDDNQSFLDKALEIVKAKSKVIQNGQVISNAESGLLKTVGEAFDKLDSSKSVEEQLDSFLKEIGMSVNDRMIRSSFVIACQINKITYESVVLELLKMYPDEKEDEIQENLKKKFKEWLQQYPRLAQQYNVSFTTLLKVFAKRFV